MSAFNKIIKFAKFDTIQMKKESFKGMRRTIEYFIYNSAKSCRLSKKMNDAAPLYQIVS